MFKYWNDGEALYHHGILGQKWGKRNGPPYPLDDKQHSSSENKAGWRKSLNATRFATKNKKKNLGLKKSNKEIATDILKTLGYMSLGTAAVVAAAGIYKSVYGEGSFKYAFTDAREMLAKPFMDADLKHHYESAKSFGERSISALSKKDYKTDYLTSNSEDAYKDLIEDLNPEFETHPASQMNCFYCTSAIAMRMKGYDAYPRQSYIGMLISNIRDVFDNVDVYNANNCRSLKDLENKILKLGEGHYGNLVLAFEAGMRHSIFYCVKNGSVEYIDGQNGERYTLSDSNSRQFSELGSSTYNVMMNGTKFADLTNAVPKNMIMSIVAPKGSDDYEYDDYTLDDIIHKRSA